MILGVKQVMSLFSAGFAKKLFVESLDIRVVVGAADDLAFIFAVKTLHALFKQFCIAMEEGLSAAVDTAAGTCHDFDRLETILVGTNHFKNLTGIRT